MASKKTAFIFPGTCVRVQMGESLIREYPGTSGLFKTADSILERPLSRIMREGPIEELQRPLHSLPATFLLSISVFNILIANNVLPSVLVGRSLGDITAAVASGAVTFEAGMRLIKARGELFEKACGRVAGSMAVILNLPPEETLALCRLSERLTEGVCEIASINTASNCVITGHSRSVNRTLELAQEKNGIAIPLPLPGPYHSSLMKNTEDEFLKILSGVEFGDPHFPVLSEPAAGPAGSGRDVFAHIAGTAGRCVNWVTRIGMLKDMEIARFLEIGPNQGMAVIASKLLEGSSGRNIETHADIRSLLRQPS